MDSNILKAFPSVWLQGCRFVANPGVMEDMLFSFYSTSESGQLRVGLVVGAAAWRPFMHAFTVH